MGSVIVICSCHAYVEWTQAPYPVCECGHLSEEHLNGTSECLGIVEIKSS